MSVSPSVITDSAIPWAVACQAPLSVEFSWQRYWSGLPFPSPGDLPDPGIELGSRTLQADSLLFELPGKPQHVIKRYVGDHLVYVLFGLLRTQLLKLNSI